ncbi:gamma-glutamyltransferase family protein [Cohnella thailandensis]|uniref:Gamma-glutamyltransferase family protein n=1 Tax=Cohnella thailandensis TaxID=557557 RepID=A0A841T581_9BACL|nr:gamma-glutamyltransferase family protein [Cohnella thailandensis]MBB6636291.1 gamma-glutamyltransferase family protein [Cohnella thailandensis]MBP1973740.1 gamma-glutamyltranspeptidase/glutathione hydrolase [Cohnella thailandensis]
MAIEFDALSYPNASRRTTVYGRKGMVATSQQLAAQAGLDILKRGGNAVDAAIATAACLTVVEPTSNGIGGDAFALVWMKGELHGLNASGPAPMGISIDKLKAQGFAEMPKYGWHPVTVPGAPSAWAALAKRFGRLPLAELLEPAIRYAEEGYAVSPTLSSFWHRNYERHVKEFPKVLLDQWSELFMPEGAPPKPGDIWRSRRHAETLAEIAATDAESFYRGALADRIDRFSRETGGYLRKEDLARFAPEWVKPINSSYKGCDVWELPPNGQGIVTLMALNIFKGLDTSGDDAARYVHRQIEAMKLAFEDGLEEIADPSRLREGVVAELLSEEYADRQRRRIGEEAIVPRTPPVPTGGTVYLCTADGEGNMVSYIQSNYMEFGSGLVVPGTGIALHNRGHSFSLNPAHRNALEPGKRTYHTIIPGFLSKDGEAIGPFGVMGAFMQPQGHFQVVLGALDRGLNPQAILDAPRWRWDEGRKVLVEPSFPRELAEALRDRGHEIAVGDNPGLFGRGQIIWRNPRTGVLSGGTDPRTDGAVVAW